MNEQKINEAQIVNQILKQRKLKDSVTSEDQEQSEPIELPKIMIQDSADLQTETKVEDETSELLQQIKSLVQPATYDSSVSANGYVEGLIDAIVKDKSHQDRPTGMNHISKVQDYFRHNPLSKGAEKDIEKYMHKAIKEAATTGAPTSIPPLFLDVLSAVSRASYTSQYIFHQFAMSSFEPGMAAGRDVLVYRANYLAKAQTEAHYLLATANTFNPVAPVTGGSDSQEIVGSAVPVTVKAYGRFGADPASRPIFIPAFHQDMALRDLVRIAQSQLVENYYSFEEMMLRTKAEASTNILFSINGSVNPNPASLVAGTGGTVTFDSLTQAHSYMYAAQTKALPDGNYIAALNPYAWGTLVASMKNIYQGTSKEQVEEVTSLISMATNRDADTIRVSNYMGCYAGFHVFKGNSFGSVTGTPTVNTVNTFTAYDSFLMAPGALGKGIAEEMSIVPSGTVPFGVGEAYTWKAIEGYAGLDVDSTLSAGQQNGVFKLRATRVEI